MKKGKRTKGSLYFRPPQGAHWNWRVLKFPFQNPLTHVQQNRPSHRDNATRGWKDRQNKSKGGDDHQSRERKDNCSNTGQDGDDKEHKGRGFRRDPKAKYREGRAKSQAPAQWKSELASIKDTLASLSKGMASLTKVPPKDAEKTSRQGRWWPSDSMTSPGAFLPTT